MKNQVLEFSSLDGLKNWFALFCHSERSRRICYHCAINRLRSI